MIEPFVTETECQIVEVILYAFCSQPENVHIAHKILTKPCTYAFFEWLTGSPLNNLGNEKTDSLLMDNCAICKLSKQFFFVR